MIKELTEIEVLTFFVADVAETKAFYEAVFGLPVVFEDEVSSVMKFGNLMINVLQSSEASELVQPKSVAANRSAPGALLTIKVPDVNAVCDELKKHGVALLNGPVDRPWGRRTAAFEDPAGHVWEVAQEI